MARRKQPTVQEYGAELGAGIKQGLQGLNTACSPKKRKTCIRLITIPLLLFMIGIIVTGIASVEESTALTAIGGLCTLGLFCLGLYQFYVGRIGKGILYTITLGGFFIGCLIDLFKLTVTKTFKDANGFPLIY